MSSFFRLNSLRIEEKSFSTKEILFTKSEVSNDDNFYTLIVGNNGTGKSRLLGSIARYFSNYTLAANGRNMFGDGFNYENHPKSVIALTSSVSDKFPNDYTFTHNRYIKRQHTVATNYHYLGNRNNANAFSSKVLLSRALDIMFANISNDYVLEKYEYLFNYLHYKPVLKIIYRNVAMGTVTKNENITEDDIINYIKERVDKNSYSSSYFKTFMLSRKEHIPELCNLLNKIKKKKYASYQLIVNFSSANVARMDKDKSDYSETTREFFLFGLLERLEIVKRFSVMAYKEDNSEFDFNEASSGEVNILSTLIALIPLISDGCLILIDEPEISLHPSWQYRYIELLLKIFKSVKGCHIIIASHSHFLVSDLPPGNSAVITLSNEKGIIKSDMVPGSTYGWATEDILLNIFKLPTTRNYYLSQLITEALELLANHRRSDERLELLKSKITELEPLMKEYDPLKDIMNSIISFKS
jgi:predicted ATPase